VIDSTATNYTVKWVFHLPAQLTIFRPALADSVPVYNGMQMIFKVSEMGAFVELLNWEEVGDTYFRAMELASPAKKDSTMASVLKSAKEMYRSKEMVESSMIQEIRLFHMPYGYKFSTEEVRARTQIENPYGGDPFPAIQTSSVTGVDPKKDAFTLRVNLRIDKANNKGMIDSLMKKINIIDNQEMRAGKEKYGSFDMHDFSEYNFMRSSGWIRRLYYKRTVVTTGTTQSDAYTITLKE
jgi:hypothetical protein